MGLGKVFPVFATGSFLALPAALVVVSALQAQVQSQVEAEAVAGQGNVQALLQKGLTHFREGRYAEAVKAFEQAFALNPQNDQIARFMNQANRIVVMQMVRSDDPRISGIGRQILELSRASRRARVSDTERIKALVDQVFASSSPEEQLKSMIQGAQEFGRNLVPALLPKLGNPETSVRTLAILWVTKMERDAVPPLLAAARHPNPRVRQNVARLLGARPIRDPFSLATLKGLMETDPDEVVKEAAGESLQAILEDGGLKEPLPAKEYHLRYAHLLYLKPHKNPFTGPDYAPTLYRLKGEELETEVVAPFQLSSHMAEEELIAALRLDPDLSDAKVLRLLNEALMVVEYDQAVKAYGSDPEMKVLLEKQKQMMDSVRRLRIRAQPPEVLFAALEQSLSEKRPEVAQKLLEVIQENRIRGSVPPAMIAALTDESSRLVRIAAAVALAHWNPEEVSDFDGEAVVSTLAEAAVSSGIRTVHQAMGNADNASRLESILRELGLEAGSNQPEIAVALERTISLPPDLVLVDQELRMERRAPQVAAVNAFINELRKAYRTAGTPVVVLVDPAKLEAGKALYENKERRVLVLPADCDGIGFKTQVLDPLFSASDDEKAHASRLARRASEALAYLSSTNTRFPLKASVEPLGQVLQGRPDEVRIPALRALGNLRGEAAEALNPITLVYQDEANAVEVREAAMVAIGRILAGVKKSASAEVLRAIRSGMVEADPRLREASFVAFGSAGASGTEELRALTDEARPPAVAVAGGEKPAETPVKGEKKAPAEEDSPPEAEEGAEAAKPTEEAPAEAEPAAGEEGAGGEEN